MSEKIEIQCIVKTNRTDPHERIKAIGGKSGSTRWLLEQQEAIYAIEANRYDFYVDQNGRRVNVVVAVSRYGNKYLKTVADGESPNNLLELNSCPV